MDNDTINFNLVSDTPLPENIEDIFQDVLNIICVATLARGTFDTQEDVEAIVEAVFSYTDSKAYERHIVAQVLQQFIAQSVSSKPEEDVDENGN